MEKSTTKTFFRWLAFLPASIVGIIVVPVIVDIGNSLAPEWWRESIMEYIKSVAGAAAFVIFGALTAPKYQLNISIALAVIYGIFSGFLFGKLVLSGFNTANLILGIVGAFGACLYIKSQAKPNDVS
ncbi:MAG TPA: hypothetical protein VFP33_01140 [Gallionella sp.]|nr:hypothetical protein [Gallionella sp.]